MISLVDVIVGVRIGDVGCARLCAIFGGTVICVVTGAMIVVMIGAMIGARVGSRIGSRIGARVGARLGVRIGDRIGNRVCARVGMITAGEDDTLFSGEAGIRLDVVIYDDDLNTVIFFRTSQQWPMNELGVPPVLIILFTLAYQASLI